MCSKEYTEPILYYPESYNLERCTLRATYIKTTPFVIDTDMKFNPGLMISLFNIIQNATGINMEYEYVDEYQDEFISEGKQTKLFKHLKDGQTDIILGRIYMNLMSEHFEPGPQIYTDELICVAPKPKIPRIYRNIFKVFSVNSWLLLLGFLLLVIVVYLRTLKFYHQTSDNARVLTEILRASINLPVAKIPKRLTLKILMLFYSIYSTHVVAIYLGKLSSIFTIPDVFVINTAEKFYTNDLYFNITTYIEQLTHVRSFITNSDYANSIYVLNQTDYELFRKVATSQENGTITFRSTIKTYSSERATVELFRLGHYSFCLCYYMKKTNIINKPVVYWTNEVIEKGILSKWWKDIILERVNTTILGNMFPGETVVLTMAHYGEVFAILIGGYILAIMVFFMEFALKFYGAKITLMKERTEF